MPGEDGLSLARHLRERYATIAIVMLTSAVTVVDRIVGLEMGADDYVTKPFDPRELLARVKSVLRRTSSARRADLGAERVRIGRCVLDLAAHKLTDEKGDEVAMSPLEFDLLKAFAEHPQPATLTRTHPEPQAAGLGPVRPQRRSAHHAATQEDRARSRASEIHTDHPQRRVHLRARRGVSRT
jgi:DNA-binding response OmpR family regulator